MEGTVFSPTNVEKVEGITTGILAAEG